MKIININGARLRFEWKDYPYSDFLVNIYDKLLKSKKSLIDLLINNNDDNLTTNIALRLKNGEKLEVCNYKPNKLSILDVHKHSIRLKNKKYLYVCNLIHDEEPYIEKDGYVFIPYIKAWFDEGKLLDKNSLNSVVVDYIDELNREIEKFETMVYYTEYETPEYYLYKDSPSTPYKYCEQMNVNGKIMKVTTRCIKYIEDNNLSDEEAKDIIYNDINNLFVDPFKIG